MNLLPKASDGEMRVIPEMNGKLAERYLDHGYRIHYNQATLGDGSFGKIRLAIHLKTSQMVAIKTIKKDKLKNADDEDIVNNELLVLRRLKHANIVRLLHHLETKDEINLVLEYCPNGDLGDYVQRRGKLAEVEAKRFMFQLLQSLAFIHANGIFHRDICPANILLTSVLSIKLKGFQFTYDRFRSLVSADNILLNLLALRAEFAPPEALNYEENAAPNINNFAGDIWCSGIVFYFLLTGKLPFNDVNLPRLFKKIKAGVYAKPCDASPLALDFLDNLLQLNANVRVSANDALDHSFLNGSATMASYVVTNNAEKHDYIDRIDPKVLNVCLALHGGDVRNREELTFNILYRHSYQTATYWLVKNNFDYFKKLQSNHADEEKNASNIRREFNRPQQRKQTQVNCLASLGAKREDGGDGREGLLAHRVGRNQQKNTDQVVGTSSNEEKMVGSIPIANDYRARNCQFVSLAHGSIEEGTTRSVDIRQRTVAVSGVGGSEARSMADQQTLEIQLSDEEERNVPTRSMNIKLEEISTKSGLDWHGNDKCSPTKTSKATKIKRILSKKLRSLSFRRKDGHEPSSSKQVQGGDNDGEHIDSGGKKSETSQASPSKTAKKLRVPIVTRLSDVDLCREKSRRLLARFGVNSQVEDKGSKLRCCLSAQNQVLLVFEIHFDVLPNYNRDDFVVLSVEWIRGSKQDFETISQRLVNIFERQWNDYKGVEGPKW